MENELQQEEKKHGLPPMIGNIIDGNITWKRLHDIDYELLGFFLACHLMIEHYMDEYLKATYPGLDWDGAKPTFGQRTALLSNLKVDDKFNCIPAIKHMNSVRNKLSHQVDFKIEAASLIPLAQFIKKASDRKIVMSDPKDTIDMFAMLCCSFFAGNISRKVMETKHTRTPKP